MAYDAVQMDTEVYNAPVEFAFVHGYRPKVPRITSYTATSGDSLKLMLYPIDGSTCRPTKTISKTSNRWHYIPLSKIQTINAFIDTFSAHL